MSIVERSPQTMQGSGESHAVTRGIESHMPAIEGVAHLAQRVLDAPMAVVSVPNTHRHDFAARVGLDVDGVARPDPIFEEVLRADGPIAIDDTTQDARMRQHELVVRGGVRACLLDALRASDGVPRGALGVLDTQPRRWTTEQREVLAELARVTAEVLRQFEEPQTVMHGRERQDVDVDVAFDLLCTLGADQRFVQVNDAWAQWLGWRGEDLVGRPVSEIIEPADRDPLLATMRPQDGRVTEPRTVRLLGRDGRTHLMAWRHRIDPVSGRVHAAARRIEPERELQEQLAAARATAETAVRTKERFLTSLSHEFRTPLNAVLGFASVLLESPPGLSSRQRMFLESVQANARELLFMLNDMLDYAVMESSPSTLRSEPMPLPGFLEEVLDRFRRGAQQKGVQLIGDWPQDLEPLRTDPARLRQVIMNLVGNAVRFTEKGRVVLRLVTDPSRRHARRIEVEDTGSGMPYEMLDRLFVAFQHGDSSPARYRIGNGVGLTASHAICEQMGYQMRIRSHAGVGTVIIVDLEPEALR